MKSEIKKFIARIDRLERRFKGMKFADQWLVPRDELIAVRNELIAPTLFDEDAAEAPEEREAEVADLGRPLFGEEFYT